jgi:hypothetical protein
MTIQGGSAAAPSLTFSGDTNTGIFSPAADTIAFSEGGVESMRIDASGNMGIGTSSPASTLNVANATGGGLTGANPSNEVVRITQAPSFGSGGYVLQRLFLNKTSTANDGATQSFEGLAVGGDRYGLANIGGYIDNAGSGNSVSGYFSIWTKPTNASMAERARIDSSGNLLVGTTSTSGVQLATAGGLVTNGIENFWLSRSAGGGSTMNVGRTSGAGTGTLVEWTYNGATRGTVTTNGTTVAYNTSSDYRLKNTIAPMTGALAKVALLKPVTYKWNVDDSESQGFIAHELQAVVPECVTGEKDAVDADGNPVYQGIDTSFLVATLTAALQELKAELDATKAEVALLKGAA